MNEFPKQQKQFYLPGPVGPLQVVAQPAKETSQNITAIVCHPHSQQGGSLTNKVVTTVARAMNLMGVDAVRFNFRSVGDSEGDFDHGVGEVDDLLTVVDWVNTAKPGTHIWLAGFSFGSFVSTMAATRAQAQQLISIGPPVVNFDFEQRQSINCPWLIIQGGQDEVVDPQAVKKWEQQLQEDHRFIWLDEPGHFFHGKLIELREIIIDELQERLD